MTDPRIEIRRATEAEAGLLAVHRVSMFHDMGSVEQAVEPVLLEAATIHIAAAMASGEYVAWLAFPAGEPERIVGGIGLQLRRLLPRPEEGGTRVLIGREGIVLNLYVERDFRRRGVARRLMEEILAWVRGRDVVRLVLHASVEGRQLYETMGFVATNEMRYRGELG